jgi:alpha-mannosidase
MAWRHELSKHFYQVLSPVSLEGAFTKDQYRLSEALENLDFQPISPGTPWGSKWEYGWFKGTLTLPDAAEGQMVALMMDTGAESAVYINGEYAGAVDEYHKVIIISDSAKSGEVYTVVLESYAGHGPQEWRSGPTPPDRETIPEPPEHQREVGQSHFGIWQEVAYQLSMDVETLWEVRENIEEESLRVMEIDDGLKDFTLIADFEQPREQMLASFSEARKRLKPLLEKKNGDTTPEMIGFGHAHIDVAWLWPLAETERKCVRTFSTQLALMERYPEYQFMQSQPQLYALVKEKYPDLYQKIIDAVERGQWIPDGASWVEPDTNVTGGESLIRQLIHGLRFYKEEFGIDCEMLWLPDVFGYSGALPQIMRGCGLRFFSTQKIFWAYHGGAPFPYNTFVWEGIDGSEVLAHFHNDYNSETKPSVVINRWKERVQKDGFSKRLYPFGWGDGGGGPTREHLEYVLREKDLEGVPKFRIAGPMVYFNEQEASGWPEARYVGELYFQAHRGTYTSQAQTKKLNRQSEYALREAELWGAAATLIGEFEFPFEDWDKNWKKVLLNQFHDILPGSSIQRVYDEAEKHLSEVIDWAAQTTKSAMKELVKPQEELTVFNSLSWQRDALIELPDGFKGLKTGEGSLIPTQERHGKTYAEVHLPSCGWIGFKQAESNVPDNSIIVEDRLLENDLMRVQFNDYGGIISIFDKLSQSELTIDDCNSFKMYQDIPSAFDAWDIDSMYRQSPVDLPDKADIKILSNGPLFGQLQVKRKLNNSTMVQEITIYRNSRRMDFHTVIDWQERHKLLKVNFPVGYHAKDALHEIQFGHLPRPTHRSREIDRDRHEVANHKWTALVETQRGFAILNDSKYGVDVLDNNINLTLLKSALAPDMNADRGRQEFTYAFYFWNSPFIESNLVQQGYELNIPVNTIEGSGDEQTLFEIEDRNIILETFKPVEDGSKGEVVLRLYESMGTRTKTRLKTSLPIEAVHFTDMLENELASNAFRDGLIDLEFGSFEIITLKLKVLKP